MNSYRLVNTNDAMATNISETLTTESKEELGNLTMLDSPKNSPKHPKLISMGGIISIEKSTKKPVEEEEKMDDSYEIFKIFNKRLSIEALSSKKNFLEDEVSTAFGTNNTELLKSNFSSEMSSN